MAIPGTNSTARQNPDGTWDVLDVPVIHDGKINRYNGAGEKVDEFTTDAKWFRHVLSVHAKAESEGRLGRAFLDHHEDDESGSQPDAGYIRPQRIGELVVDGDALPALFCDIVSIPDDVYQSYVKTGRLAGRSIESLVSESGWIDGLALMPTRPAHYTLPILTIGDEVVSVGTPDARREPLAAVACASKERALRIYAKEPQMADEQKKDDEQDEGNPVAKGEGEGGDKGSESEGGGGTTSGWKSKLDALKACNLTAEEIPEVVAAITEFATSLETPAGDSEVVDDDIATMDDSPIAEQEAAPEELMAKGSSAAVIKAEAMAAAALAKAQATEDEMALRDAIDAAVVELADKHPSLSDRAVLRAKAKTHGLDGMKMYVETLKAHAVSNPGINGARPPESHVEDIPDEVNAYTDHADREVALGTWKRIKAHASAGFDMDGISLKGAIKRDIAATRKARA